MEVSDDLTCEHKSETYEGYVSPFGSSYSVPSSNRQFFIWAASDLHDQNLKVVIVSPNGGSRVLTSHRWMKRLSIANVPSMERPS